MKQTDVVQSASIEEQNQLRQQQQQEINYAIDIQANTRQTPPNLPRMDLLTGPRTDYFKIGVPLYEASLECDWRAAKAILDRKPELLRYSISENGETALHVAASAKGSRRVEAFVQNLVGLMKAEDLALENKNYNTALYLASAAGNLQIVKIMVAKNRTLLTITGGGGPMLPLNAAASFGNYEVVKYLYENSCKLRDNGWTPQNRAWLLDKCVENDMFDVAIHIVEEYPELGRGSGSVLGVLARKPEAFCETSENIIQRIIKSVVAFVTSKVGAPENERNAFQLLRIIWEDIEKMPEKEIYDILRGPPDAIMKPVSGNLDRALEFEKIIYEHIVNMHVETQKVIMQDVKPTSGREDQALQLKKVISEHIANMQVKTQNITRGPVVKETYSSRVLFIAAEMGNTTFVVELIRRYPDLMWKVNDNNQTIFHIAVKHRHQGIYNLLYEIGSMKDSITSIVDENDNNMLHLVAKIAKKQQLEEVSGVASQMQQELLWFKEVESMIPHSFRKQKNKDGLTPHELFTKEHEDLAKQSEKWIKGTANQGMVVAALVITIVFAAAFTVPGGYNQNSGIPIFYQNQAYTIFIVADAISLFLSSASTIMFISILTSRFAIRDFLESLPKKVIIFLSTLFLSIITMLITFCVSFFILYHNELRWIPILISVFAAMPVLIYITMQYYLIVDLYRLAYRSRYIFKPVKQVHFFENPKV